MADKDNKHPRSVPGPYYVDDSCIDCDLCRENAPAFFRRDDHSGFSHVWHQPVTPEEIAGAEAALAGCPTESIGNDGEEGP